MNTSNRIKAGIEIPIIPEDFETSAEATIFDIMKSCLEQADQTIQDEAFAVEWAVAESLFDHCCRK